MLINLSNHPIAKWSMSQLNDAQRRFGDCVDVPFPHVSPFLEYDGIHSLVVGTMNNITSQYGCENITIHIMGEMTFVYDFVQYAATKGIRCVASTTDRIVVENPDGTKTSTFSFVKFREYGN